MGYGRHGPNQPPASDHPTQTRRPRRALFLAVVIAIALLIASAIAATLFLLLGTDAAGSRAAALRRQPSKAIAKACQRTRYPTLCVDSLVDFPGALSASEPDLVHISVNMTLQRFGRALYATSDLTNLPMDSPRLRSAYDDCLELLDDSVEALSRSLMSVLSGGDGDGGSSSPEDAVTWLSAALTNHDICTKGLEEVSGTIKNQMVSI